MVARLIDRFGRSIDYMRISVTDRCNLHCIYCSPLARTRKENPTLSDDDIALAATAARNLGIRKLRITGGEPLTRPGIVELIRRISGIDGIDEVSLTTNGLLLPFYAEDLAKAGLARINVSLDTLNPETFESITGSDHFHTVIRGVMRALAAGLRPVKINVVMMQGFNDHELPDFVRLSIDHPLQVRFIELMPIGNSRDIQAKRFISNEVIKNRLHQMFKIVDAKVAGAGPSMNFVVPGGKGTLGFISPISGEPCCICNKIRLDSKGFFRPCLSSDITIDAFGDRSAPRNLQIVEAAIRSTVSMKPRGHCFTDISKDNHQADMIDIGG